MFEGIDLNKVLQQVQEMQKTMQQQKEERKNIFHSISVGGGMVEMEINEEMEIRNLKIDKDLLRPEEHSSLQELILLAFNQAIQKVKSQTAPNMNEMIAQMQNNFLKKN